jgi:tetraacyldisaccharide 4'-kinase
MSWQWAVFMNIATFRTKFQSNVSAVLHSRDRYPYWSLATPLFGASILYNAVSSLRHVLYARNVLTTRSLPCKVISVGNITVGGTGKTPMTINLVRLLQQMRCRVAVVSRGYKGTGEKNGAVVSDGQRILCSPRTAGDEPYLMACLLDNVPVVIGKDRYAAGERAMNRFRPDVIVLDDGFQHRRLQRDLNLLLLDAKAPFGNRFLLPRGQLREPVSALKRADAVILTRCDGIGPNHRRRIQSLVHPRPLFSSQHKTVIRGILPARQPCTPQRIDFSEVSGHSVPDQRKIFAFCGLAANAQFFKSLKTMAGDIHGTMEFEDHHPYTPRDIERILWAARHAGSNGFATTEKDYVRIPNGTCFPEDLFILGIDIDLLSDRIPWRRYVQSELDWP